MNLNGKVAIVTGASRGLGKQFALDLARRGAAVAVAARTVDKHKRLPGTIGDTLQAIEAIGGRAIAVQTDVTNRDDLRRLVDTTVEQLGRLDILINNAAETRHKPALVEDYPLDVWLSQFNANLHAPFVLTGLAVPHMEQQGEGAIVNITSNYGDHEDLDLLNHLPPVDPLGSMVGYGVTKAALNRMTNILAIELARKNIAAIAFDPGMTRTELMEEIGARGLMDISASHPMDVPSARVMKMLTDPHPLRYSGRVIHIGAKYQRPM